MSKQLLINHIKSAILSPEKNLRDLEKKLRDLTSLSFNKADIIKKYLKLGKGWTPDPDNAHNNTYRPISVYRSCGGVTSFTLFDRQDYTPTGSVRLRGYFRNTISGAGCIEVDVRVSVSEIIAYVPKFKNIVSECVQIQTEMAKVDALIERLEMLSVKQICSALNISLTDFLLKGFTEDQVESIRKHFS